LSEEKENLKRELAIEIGRLENLGQLSSKSTTKFKVVRELLGQILEIPSDLIYVSTVDKAANANARMQQMQIRRETPWKVFVGVCTREDVKSSSTYFSQTQRNLESPNIPGFQGSLWLSRLEGLSSPLWSPARAVMRKGSHLESALQQQWPRLYVTSLELDAPAAEPTGKPQPDLELIKETAPLDLSHLDLEPMLDALINKPKQIILAGPPGTGKSHAALALANVILGGKGVEDHSNLTFVQFHPTYEYEDFIEGFRPRSTGEGYFELQLTAGLLLSLIDEMRETPQERRVLIIDEMNRANLAKVLGEVLYLLEYREKEILLKSGTALSIPSNLHIIATMNTADRNIRAIDIALRRRFRYFNFEPSIDALRNFFSVVGHSNALGEELFTGFEALNQDLEAVLDKHHRIGHTFFMEQLLTNETLRTIWDYQIAPTLEDYFFDRPDIYEEFSANKYFPSISV
jgi:hypothetical protein